MLLPQKEQAVVAVVEDPLAQQAVLLQHHPLLATEVQVATDLPAVSLEHQLTTAVAVAVVLLLKFPRSLLDFHRVD